MNWERLPWFVAGPLIGLLLVGLRAVLNKPFGALGGFVELTESLKSPTRFGFRTFLLLGLVAGGLLYAFTLGRAPVASSWVPLPVLLGAGLMIGFGARTAGGCTSGHGMSGVSVGSRASLVATMTFFATAVAVAHAVGWLGGGR